MSKLSVLNGGGIAIVSTPSIKYMARNAHVELRKYISKESIDFHTLKFEGFSRGEFLAQIRKNIRHKAVYLFYDFNMDASHDLVGLAMTTSAMQDAGAKSVTIVAPYIPFLRQDRKDRSRVPISAKVSLQIMELSRIVGRTITLDMHADQIQIGFQNPSDHLPGHVIFTPWIKERFGDQLDKVVIVGPDAGSEKRVMKIASILGCKRSFLTKSRAGRGDVSMHEIHGAKVQGKICIINDDIIDTGGTIIKAAEALMARGAEDVIISATHAVFGKKDGVSAYKKLKAAGFEVVVTDSLLTKEKKWLTVLPLARYMAHAILQNIVPNGSVSKIITKGLPD